MSVASVVVTDAWVFVDDLCRRVQFIRRQSHCNQRRLVAETSRIENRANLTHHVFALQIADTFQNFAFVYANLFGYCLEWHLH